MASDAPSELPSFASLAPTTSTEPSLSASPSMAPNVTVTETPSQTPTEMPSAIPTATPSEAPTVPLQRYLITVSLLIGNGAEDIEWGFYDFDSDEKIFGYPQGWYETDGFSVSTVILQSGTYEFILARGSDTATAIVEFGILNQQTGGVEEIATVNLGTTSIDPDATAVFSLD